MSKKIFSIGYEVPGNHAEYVDFSSEKSLMDADILLISPGSLRPSGDWVSFSSSDGGCYNVEASKKYKQKMSHLQKEIKDHTDSGRSVFIFLTPEEKKCLAYAVSTTKGQRSYSTETYSNYNFLPIGLGTLTSASGNHVQFCANSIFGDFYKKFEKHLEYQAYIENLKNAQIVFTGKNKAKILGAVYKIGAGNLIVLPCLKYDYDKFVKTKKDKNGKEKSYWTDAASKFGHSLVECLVKISNELSASTDKTPAPEWVNNEPAFVGTKEKQIVHSIASAEKKLSDLKKEIEKLNTELSEEQVLKDLLFEQGKPLEKAVIKALKILGYNAENYNDGDLEMDQIIISPEGHRYIGECEGKNEKDIDISKFRQLTDSMNEDYAREEVEEKAFGILFGNPQRFTPWDKRTLDFTKKCKSGAEREKIALIKTADLYKVTKYLTENEDKQFQKGCRESIHKGLGAVIAFPDLPMA